MIGDFSSQSPFDAFLLHAFAILRRGMGPHPGDAKPSTRPLQSPPSSPPHSLIWRCDTGEYAGADRIKAR